MEYANDEVFKIRYNTNLNRLQVMQESGTSRVFKMIKKHKFITMIVAIFLIFSVINMMMVISFMQILNQL